MQSYLRCLAKEVQRIWKYVPATAANVEDKVSKNLQQHSKGCPERALSLQTIWTLQSMICFPGCSCALNQSPFCPSTMIWGLCQTCASVGHTVTYGALLVHKGFSKKQVMEEATFPVCKVRLVRTLLCAYRIILMTLREPFSNQVFIY